MSKFHITPSGQARVCHAHTPETCKYSQEAGEVVAHYDTKEEAQAAYEQQMKQNNNHTPSLKKKTNSEFNSDDVAEESSEKKYYVIEEKYDKAIDSLNKANKKLENAGIEERFEYTIEEKIEIRNTNGIKKYIPYYELTVSTPSISYTIDNEKYEFQAVIESTDAGYITRSAVDLEGWKPKDLTCDHCGRKRTRNKTYIVKAPDGSRKQIGSSCVQAYLGVKPAGLWALSTSPVGTEENYGFDSISTGSSAYDPEELMALAMAETNEGKNYISKSRAIENESSSTIDHINALLINKGKTKDDWTKPTFDKADEYKSSGKAKEIIKRLKNFSGNNDYISNLKVLANSQFIRPKDMAFFVSGIAAIAREDRLKQQAEEKNQREKEKAKEFTPGHFGKVNDKIEKGTEFTVYSKSEYGDFDYYGNPITKTRILAKDSEGHQIIWFTGANIESEIGEPIALSSGKVKKHGQYNGIDQTMLSNVRLLKKK